ncbi:hypothetical protein PV326_002570 [Microctonus aethiopoides]|nr:hypothetical protein PV326_002570 [Microctonus aethiopoides]
MDHHVASTIVDYFVAVLQCQSQITSSRGSPEEEEIVRAVNILWLSDSSIFRLGPESWCKWRKSDTEGTLDTFEYSPALDDDAQATLKPVYEGLIEDSLSERCLRSNTQKNNERFNACT